MSVSRKYTISYLLYFPLTRMPGVEEVWSDNGGICLIHWCIPSFYKVVAPTRGYFVFRDVLYCLETSLVVTVGKAVLLTSRG